MVFIGAKKSVFYHKKGGSFWTEKSSVLLQQGVVLSWKVSVLLQKGGHFQTGEQGRVPLFPRFRYTSTLQVYINSSGIHQLFWYTSTLPVYINSSGIHQLFCPDVICRILSSSFPNLSSISVPGVLVETLFYNNVEQKNRIMKYVYIPFRFKYQIPLKTNALTWHFLEEKWPPITGKHAIVCLIIKWLVCPAGGHSPYVTYICNMVIMLHTYVTRQCYDMM